MTRPFSKTILLSLALWPLAAPAAGMFGAPVETSGDMGYTFRTLTGTTTGDSVSHQMRASINAGTWLWQPWLATLNLGLRGTADVSDFEREGLSSSNNATIVTGDLDLGVLSQSRTPFQLSYRVSDSRVDTIDVGNPVTTSGGKEFQTSRLAMKQTYFTEQGYRFQARFDQNEWTSNFDKFDDWLLGLDMSMRMPKQTFLAKGSYQNSNYSALSQETDNIVLNVDHFYYPTKSLRIDSMATLYDIERSSTQPFNSLNQANSTTDLTQLSSFVFWRPQDKPLSLSGGVRLYDLDSTTTGNSVAVQNMSATAGMLYQYTKNLRLDANLDTTVIDSEGQQTTASKQRAGALYQSDLYEFLTGYTYQWFSTLGGQWRSAEDQDNQSQTMSLGHDVQKVWMANRFTSWRLSLSQSGNGSQQTTNDVKTNTERLDHSASLSWDQRFESSTSSVQLTLTDARQFGGSKNDQQFLNVQALRTQHLDRRQTLSGNLTIQTVRQDFNGQGNNDTVTTATGQISYRHSRILGVPRLQYMSDMRVSRAARDSSVDRSEWENRLDYAVGLLDTRFSWRITDLNGENFSLVYFQVTRRF